MNKQLTLSVVLSNYNDAQYIGEALEAMLNQSYRPMEIIVIDDGSTDNSIEAINRFVARDPIVRLFRNEQNQGLLFSLNRALAIASGDYIYAASANDRIEPGFFEKSLTLLAEYPQAGVCCSDVMTFDNETKIYRQYPLRISEQPCYFSAEDLTQLMRRRGAFRMPSIGCICKRTAVQAAGNYLLELGHTADTFLIAVIAFREGFCYLPECLTTYRILPQCYTSNRDEWSIQSQVMNDFLGLLKSDRYRDILPRIRRSGVLCAYNDILRIILNNRDYWTFITPLFLTRAVLYELKVAIAKRTPQSIREIIWQIKYKRKAFTK